ncbi:MAG: flagellar biosynthesis anti-sigma factor FlgM [Gammaproteobacteria bacterium]|jgi:negative regulator of flagellin synthesis FlgM|nr:flagellar biosynthesis anti-sigma factor FlgM [Gammaproteobacteria bacterium]MBU0773479.1 flagellar biosynthesis anti-sigma factor FlgM [Gammaproteobacteria bacterium]MBU0856689.1 flagellar biosynthesis anti-sigma factor FlgM [Gammaproteobacteria bacterium]MBU1846781.1 flagellar biosynthesis anti-sigma factor FlgM [Gammaproteobacteria bacterium]
MRVSGNAPTGAGTPVQETARAVPGTGPAAAPAPAGAALQSSVLQPALDAMRDMPEIDQARVTALREALARGEVPFDPEKLAGLIQRFHGNKG